MKLAFHADTNIGRKYTNNEDFYLVPEINNQKKSINLFILCDGMGGANAGEVASQLTAKWLKQEIDLWYSKQKNLFNFLKNQVKKNDIQDQKERITNLILKTDKRIKFLSRKFEQYNGMGTTLATAFFVGKNIIIHSVGDSRCYRLREDNFEQLTEDQSEVWQLFKMGAISKDEILSHRRNNVITEAIGVSKDLKINSYYHECKVKDLYLICSDGLTDMLNDAQIKAYLSKSNSLEMIVKDLIKAANEAGGRDNITLILVKVQGI